MNSEPMEKVLAEIRDEMRGHENRIRVLEQKAATAEHWHRSYQELWNQSHETKPPEMFHGMPVPQS